MEHVADIAESKPWYRQLYVQVLVAIVLGVLVGWRLPDVGVVKALTYFQSGTILAMICGLVAINLFPLGEGVNADPSQLQTDDEVGSLVVAGESSHWWDFLLRVVPDTFVGPFVEGEILQIIFLAVIFGVALNAVGSVGAPVLDAVQRLTAVVFKILSFIMKAAPLGAFGAMACAIGEFGLGTLTSLGSLILLFYVTSAVFVFVVLGSVMAYLRLNIFQLLRYLKEELLLILGTPTAEPALPGLMTKMEHAGVEKSTVGLVVPTGSRSTSTERPSTSRSPLCTSRRRPAPTSRSGSSSACSPSCC